MIQPPPEENPNVQMTPVEFSPSDSADATGMVPPAVRPPYLFPVWVPILIVLLTLNVATVRDIVALNRRMSDIHNENAPVKDMLAKSAKQADFVNSLKDGIEKLAPNDPVAAQIKKEFFPPPPTPPPTTPLPKIDKDAVGNPPAAKAPVAAPTK